MRGVLRLSIAAILIIGLVWARSRLAALFEQRYIVPPVPESGDASNGSGSSPSSAFSPTTVSDRLSAKQSDSPSNPRGGLLATVLGSIVKSLEQNASRIDFRPGFKQTTDKVVVVGKLRAEDTDWVAAELPDWQNAIYTVDDTSAPLHTERNKGKEANVYLTYIIENYDQLPSVIAFIHSHHKSWPQAWHTDAAEFDNARSLRSLRTDYVEQHGYANLRCQKEPGCPQEIQPLRKDKNKPTEVIFADAWQAIFNETEVPSVIAVACCAQFAVSRAQVLKRSRDEYIWYHRWLVETELADDVSGRVFEYLYHVIFGRDPIQYVESWRKIS